MWKNVQTAETTYQKKHHTEYAKTADRSFAELVMKLLHALIADTKVSKEYVLKRTYSPLSLSLLPNCLKSKTFVCGSE